MSLRARRGGYRWIVEIAAVAIITLLLVPFFTMLVIGFASDLGSPKPTGRQRWGAQATLAEMDKDGVALPSVVGEEANRSEGPPGA
jgi:hypothetical protein